MDTSDNCSRAEGVGVAYHPFLHDTLLACRAQFDFVELPLDLYVDSARAALLDPGQYRLRQMLRAKRCVWRGTALSLGTVGPDDKAEFPPHTVHSIRALLDMAGAEPYTDSVGFRTADFGPLQAMPATPEAARWIATRQAAAQAALGVPVRLCLPNPASDARTTGLDIATFLTCIAAHGGTGFVLDATDLSAAVPAAGPTPWDLVARLPAAHVAALSISSAGAPGWDMLVALANHIRPRSIILRRDRQLFPLDTLEDDISRAAELLAKPTLLPPPSAVAPAPEPDTIDLTTLRHHQTAPAGDETAHDVRVVAAQSWQNWRTQVDDMHKAQQIMALMSRSANPPVPWSQ